MAFILRHFGKVKRGIFLPDFPEMFKHFLKKYEGKEVGVSVVFKRLGKSNRQNRYYRGVVCKVFSDSTGYTVKEAHGIFQAEFFTYTNDQGLKYIRSTELKEWDTVEWEEKMSELRQWASIERNIYIPEPNEVPFEY